MQNELIRSVQVVQQGGLILYPTDTVWGIGCDASNEAAVAKIFKLKQREDSKALICLVADERMLKKYIKKIPEAAYDIIAISEEPITIIYDEPQHLAKNLIAPDNTIAIRIPNDDFCFQLLRRFNGAIVSTSANISGAPTPKSFKEIDRDIIKGVDYVVNLHRNKISTKPSSIIKLGNDGSVKIIRS